LKVRNSGSDRFFRKAAIDFAQSFLASFQLSGEELVDVIVDQLSVLEVGGRPDVADVRGEALRAVKSGLA
jgi:hypothetical protein